VTTEIIDRVRQGNWNPDNDEADRKSRGALAARAYWQAFQVVKESVSIWRGESHFPFSLRFARRDFSSSQAALVEFGAIEAASLRRDALWTDEHS
jgi:hypothetical protein